MSSHGFEEMDCQAYSNLLMHAGYASIRHLVRSTNALPALQKRLREVGKAGDG